MEVVHITVVLVTARCVRTFQKKASLALPSQKTWAAVLKGACIG